MARVFDETKREWEGFKQKKSYPYIAAVLRALYIFFLYWLFSVLIFTMIPKTTNVIKQDLIKLENLLIQLPIALIGSALELHSILLNTSQFDHAARHEFMERYDYKFDRKSERKLIRRNRMMWLEIGVITLLFFCVFSHNAAFFVVFDLIEQILLLPDIPVLLRMTLTTAAFFGILYGLEISTRLNARYFWLNPTKSRKHTWESDEKRKQKMFNNARRDRMLAISCMAVMAATVMTPTAIALLASVIAILWLCLSSKAVQIALLLLVVLFFLLAIRKRFLFLHNLKRTCKTCGFRLLELKHPVLALFHDSKGYTFALEANGQVYYCRLIASVKRSNRMVFRPDGTASRNLSLRVMQPAIFTGRTGLGRGFIQTFENEESDKRELMRFERHFRYAFECGEGKKVLLLNPVPRFAIYDVEGRKTELDNGSVIGENRDYTVYSGNAFLRLLKRESMKDE